MDEGRVAELFTQIHDRRPPRFYNEENAIRYVILDAYNFSPDSPYVTFEELSSGRGFCDLLFLPFSGSTAPALIVELKWNKTPENAISQIKTQKYIDHLNRLQFRNDVLFVGISYSEKTRAHRCKIEKLRHG